MAEATVCSNCGVEMGAEVKFCSACGTATAGGSVDAQGAETASVVAPESVVQATEEPEAAVSVIPSTGDSSAGKAGSSDEEKKRRMVMMGGAGVIVVLIGVLIAMTSSGDKRKRNRGVDTTKPAEAKVVSDTSVTPEPVATPEFSPETEPTSVEDLALSVDGVADLSLRYVPLHVRKRALKQNSRAVKQHMKENYEEAIASYHLALELWPGYLMARYNLACAYALTDDKERSMGLLKQMKVEGCIKCLERVQRARSDKDFQSLWADDDFQVLTGGIHVMLPDYKKLTKKLIRELGKGYFAMLVKAAKNDVTIDINGTDITGKDQLVRYKINLMKDFARDMGDGVNWRSYKPEFHPGKIYGYRLKCKGDCCDIYIPRGERDSSLGEGVIGTLSKVCFWPISETEAHPRLIKYSY